ncbi:MAG: alpha/beta-hydrolase family protein [Thermoleophilia bacterium]|nr:alpha/beta-hydrolase family protein [Thermoleophilia bacterium]
MTTGPKALLDEPARFRVDALDRAQLAAAWGIDATSSDVADPIRAYAELDPDHTLAQRCRAVLDDVEAQASDAGLPPVLLIGSPTGSGWVNSAALTAVEAWTRGRCASIALQYGALRSQASVRALPIAARSIAALVTEASQRIDAAGRSDGTTIVIWAESLGAWALLTALAEAPELLDLSCAVHVIWVGVPGPALADPRLRAALDARADITTYGATGDALDACALSPDRSDILLTHSDDPVAHLPGPSLVWRPQAHTVPTAIPAGTRLYRRRWMPLITALRARRTLDRVTRPPSPTLLRGVHDYRYAAASALRACLSLPRSDLPVVQRLIAQRAASVLDRAA